MDGIAHTVMHLDIELEKHVISEMSMMAVGSIMFYMMNLISLSIMSCVHMQGTVHTAK